MSYPEFKNCKTAITNDDLDAAEVAMGVIIPSDLRQHYLKYNGGAPVNRAFPDEDYHYVIHNFFPVKYGILDKPTLTLERTFARVKRALPEGLLPFANDATGNFFCYGISEAHMHSICFWDHHLYDEPDQGLTVLAPSLRVFLEKLIEAR